MLRWFVFTIAMGLLPFGFSVLLQALRGVPPAELQNSPELLFFSVLVSAAQLDGVFASLSSRECGKGEWRTLLSVLFGCFLISAILSAALYGVYLDHARNNPAAGVTCEAVVGQARRAGSSAGIKARCTEWLEFQSNLFTFSIWMSATVGVAGTFTEWIRTRRQS
jgi:hypothetical protein